MPVERHAAIKARLQAARELKQSPDEPTVWLPTNPDLLEVNLIGMDTAQRPGETYVFEDDEMPLLVFGHLSLERLYATLPADLRFAARCGLSTLSLLEARSHMPDPAPHRARLAELLARLERAEPAP